MKAVVSTTYSDTYLFFIPIITWCWNKLAVDTICFIPYHDVEVHGESALKKWDLITDCIALPGYTNNQFKNKDGEMCFRAYAFDAPEHKEATYAQCSRLYAAALDLPDYEFIVTGDVDMAVFRMVDLLEGNGRRENTSPTTPGSTVYIVGPDLTPEGQYPICYCAATVETWKGMIGQGSYQELLDKLLGDIETENFRGNYWGKDQETLFNITKDRPKFFIDRARPGTQFAGNRVDRDDINWRSYLGPDLIDAHLWRPGYTEENFANILELLQTQYPEDNFQWMIDYRNEYIKLI